MAARFAFWAAGVFGLLASITGVFRTEGPAAPPPVAVAVTAAAAPLPADQLAPIDLDQAFRIPSGAAQGAIPAPAPKSFVALTPIATPPPVQLQPAKDTPAVPRSFVPRISLRSPIVLDLDGDGIELTALEDGVRFDLLGEGRAVRCAWVEREDGLLVLDRNGNGVVDDATELFGNVTAGRTFADGFAPLRELDANGDARIDRADPAFASLRVWRDRDRDGVSTAGELSSLGDVGVAVLGLAPRRVDDADALDEHGNMIPLVGELVGADGTRAMLADVFLRYAR